MSARPNPRLRRVPIARILGDVRAARLVTLGEYWAARREEAEADHLTDLEADAEVIVGRALSTAFPTGTPGHNFLTAANSAAARALAIQSPWAPAHVAHVDRALADLALRSSDTSGSTSAPDPLPTSAADGSAGEGPLQPSPTSGPYRHTPYFEGGWAIIGPDNEHVATTKSPTTVFSVVDALNDAYRRGLAEGGAR